MKLEMSYYFDIRHFYDPYLLAFKAGTWKTKCTTAGKLPKGHNRILAENTIDELELQNHPSIVAFRSRPRTVARAHSSLPELKNRSQHNDFRAEVEEKVFEYEKKGSPFVLSFRLTPQRTGGDQRAPTLVSHRRMRRPDQVSSPY